MNTGKLIRNRNDILVNMEIVKLTSRHKIYVPVEYDKEMYKRVWKDRWDPYDNEPIQETGKLLYLLRKVVNDDQSRCNALGKVILEDNHPRAVIFYNYTYEVEAIRTALDVMGIQHTEWNGSKHEQIPDGDRWAYLVQYSAGCEGWNCTRTDTINCLIHPQRYLKNVHCCQALHVQNQSQLRPLLFGYTQRLQSIARS